MMDFFLRVERLVQVVIGGFLIAFVIAWAQGAFAPQRLVEERYGPGLASACLDQVGDRAYCMCQVTHDLQSGSVRQWRYGIRLHRHGQESADALLTAEGEDKAEFLARRILHYADLDQQCREQINTLAAPLLPARCTLAPQACACLSEHLQTQAPAEMLLSIALTRTAQRAWLTGRGYGEQTLAAALAEAQADAITACREPLLGEVTAPRCPVPDGGLVFCTCIQTAVAKHWSEDVALAQALSDDPRLLAAFEQARGLDGASGPQTAAWLAAMSQCRETWLGLGIEVLAACPPGVPEALCLCRADAMIFASDEIKIQAALSSAPSLLQAWAQENAIDLAGLAPKRRAMEAEVLRRCMVQKEDDLAQQGRAALADVCPTGAPDAVCRCLVPRILAESSTQHLTHAGLADNRGLMQSWAEAKALALERLEAERQAIFAGAVDACAAEVDAATPEMMSALAGFCEQELGGQSEACRCMVEHQRREGGYAMSTFWLMRADPDRGGPPAAERWLGTMGVSFAQFGTLNQSVSASMRAACLQPAALATDQDSDAPAPADAAASPEPTPAATEPAVATSPSATMEETAAVNADAAAPAEPAVATSPSPSVEETAAVDPETSPDAAPTAVPRDDAAAPAADGVTTPDATPAAAPTATVPPVTPGQRMLMDMIQRAR